MNEDYNKGDRGGSMSDSSKMTLAHAKQGHMADLQGRYEVLFTFYLTTVNC